VIPADGDIAAERLRELLLSVPGIGPWTAEYVLLRAFGDTDAFPDSDLVLKRALEAHPSLQKNDFSPWRAYLAVHLWQEFAPGNAAEINRPLSKRKESDELFLQ
jgi:3-methyladenine DNA glycosylase/8-oxoguanine DNA glycosylase